MQTERERERERERETEGNSGVKMPSKIKRNNLEINRFVENICKIFIIYINYKKFTEFYAGDTMKKSKAFMLIHF